MCPLGDVRPEPCILLQEVVRSVPWRENYTKNERRKELAGVRSSLHAPPNESSSPAAPQTMAKGLQLRPEEAAYLVKKVEKEKFTLADDGKRTMVLGLYEKLLEVKNGMEPLIPRENKREDED